MGLFFVSDLQAHSFILWALFTLIIIYALTFSKSFYNYFPLIKNRIQQKTLKNYLLFLILLVFTTFTYWEIDEHLINLPDPIVPYVFYILAITIYFGVITGLLTAVLTFFMVDYYLFKPRYTLALSHHISDKIIFLAGLAISLFIGYRIRIFQKILQKRAEELDLLIKARDRFTAIAAHELKTPLSTINLYSQALIEETKDVKASKMLQKSITTIQRETGILTQMINDLLDFSKIQNNKSNLNPESFDLIDLCRESMEKVMLLYPTHRYVFNSKIKRAVIYADRLSMVRVVTNLLVNSAKYSHSGSKVILSVRSEKNNFLITVKDYGKGIEKENKEKIFEPFFQMENHNKGLGLGLYISKTIVEMQNGKIWVESKPGKGSTFFVRLPFVYQA